MSSKLEKLEIAIPPTEIEAIQREIEEKNRELFSLKAKYDELQNVYDKIYERSPAGHYTLSKNGEILSLNQSASEQLSAGKELLLNESFSNFIDPEYRSQFDEHLQYVFENNSRHSCEVKVERKNKSLFFAFIESIPTYENNGSDASCITIVMDITTLKVAQDTIKEGEERFKNMANTTPVLIWVTSTDALFTFVNNYWLQYTGRNLGQELGMGWIEGIHPEDVNNFMAVYKTFFDAREPFEISFRIKYNDGNYRWIIIRGVPRFQSDGRFAGYIGSCTDINDQKEIEDTILFLNEKLKSINASKDKFFSIIAHDIKSPLTGLLGFTEILAEEYSELDEEEKKEFIGHSHQAAINLMALLENLLEWSRIQIGSIAIEPEDLNLEQIFDDIITLFVQNAANKKIKLEKKVDTKLNVLADKNSIKTIVRNLISNGIKFTKEGGTITVSADEEGDFIKLAIQDSGVGISQENIEKLFRNDVNYSTQGTNKERGTGLGLVLCKELVEKNGGNIRVESEVGNGTKFIINLPKA